MLRRASEVTVTERQRALLERWVRNGAETPHRLLERCRIVLMSADGINNIQQGRQLGIDRQRVRRWRTRWAEEVPRLAEAEARGAKDKEFAALVSEVLDDEARPGGPPKFTAEELAQVIAVACEEPAASNRPVTHWTPRELADEVVTRGIVDSISPRHLDRILKKVPSGRTRVATGSHPKTSATTR
jgi:putative transposase